MSYLPPDPIRGEGADARRRLPETATADDHRDLIAFGPADEAEARVEATLVTLSAALLNEIEMNIAVEAAILSLEQAARFLKVVRR